MNCPKCGKPVENSAKFCEFCGATVERGSMQTPVVVANKPNTGDVRQKNVGATLKKMWILAAVAIVLVIITHFIAMVPISRESQEIVDDRTSHLRGHSSSNCQKCKSYKEDLEEINHDGAVLWRETITDCSLIALAGAVVYGVGAMVEKREDS